MALARAFVDLGGTIAEGFGATDVEGHRTVRTVRWPGGSVMAGHVVLATLLPFPMAGM